MIRLWAWCFAGNQRYPLIVPQAFVFCGLVVLSEPLCAESYVQVVQLPSEQLRLPGGEDASGVRFVSFTRRTNNRRFAGNNYLNTDGWKIPATPTDGFSLHQII